ncbi:MAG: DUF4143 domain-containing protein, partial [Bdellovibrionales bacterium]|nr:DUF4143 domain-containing protein [Bdellovibrionales bacterium]
ILATYVNKKNIASLSTLYKSLWQAYKDDVEKYGKNATNKHIIRHVIDSAPFEEDRIKFEGFGGSNYRSREVGEALRALDLARVIQLIYPTTHVAPPVMADMKKRPRLQFLDTGFLNQILHLQGEMLRLGDLQDMQRGKIIQHLITQELISVFQKEPYKPHFWVRESKDANSEVDMVFQHGRYLIPIEVKSGKQGRLRSLHQYVERANHPYAVRLYAGELRVEEATTPGGTPYLLLNLPYYLGTKIPEYIEYFIENYSLEKQEIDLKG